MCQVLQGGFVEVGVGDGRGNEKAVGGDFEGGGELDEGFVADPGAAALDVVNHVCGDAGFFGEVFLSEAEKIAVPLEVRRKGYSEVFGVVAHG